ncbi:hypothetical protein ACFWPU_00780 [Streptomyces sp. NPDC058471]|uniref:hypothetical protein n=1 Tax=Streptomyces sp. NPDC058471 TaxID=3346516 RepID=UPI00366665EA
MIYTVAVWVALSRPPTPDERREYTVEADDTTGALLAALQMASCTSTMAVEAVIVADTDHPET